MTRLRQILIETKRLLEYVDTFDKTGVLEDRTDAENFALEYGIEENSLNYVMGMMASLYKAKFKQSGGEGSGTYAIRDYAEDRQSDKERAMGYLSSSHREFFDFYVFFYQQLSKIDNPKDYNEVFGFVKSPKITKVD